MATPTKPDDVIKQGKFHLFLAALLFFGGCWLIHFGYPLAESYWKELIMTIGAGMITAALFDVVFHYAVDRYKHSITKDVRKTIDRLAELREQPDTRAPAVQDFLKHTGEKVERIDRENDHKEIMIELQSISERLQLIERRGNSPRGE